MRSSLGALPPLAGVAASRSILLRRAAVGSKRHPTVVGEIDFGPGVRVAFAVDESGIGFLHRVGKNPADIRAGIPSERAMTMNADE